MTPLQEKLMKANNRSLYWHMLFFIVAVTVGVFQLYLWGFAPCAEIKTYWYLTHTPARCIALQPVGDTIGGTQGFMEQVNHTLK